MTNVKQTAGRLILGVGDQDRQQVMDALRGFHPSGNLALVFALADTAAAALEALHGEGWRDALSLAMLDAELDEAVDG
ncbi:hypothetical protein [Microbacterium esteraromaticum]|uniref:hypothetical protein n=1 Tax=Microbacterium esteraromaticum TaxID=57043 RepID=UPI0019D33E00|nr:hypothetical protein [Microbacterium esteraromaticum]MBN7792510.1 hypothetical protein [Microbacterium esteraromaticum]